MYDISVQSRVQHSECPRTSAKICVAGIGKFWRALASTFSVEHASGIDFALLEMKSVERA